LAASGRLRLRHGPIDLILDLAGDAAAVRQGEAAARAAFAGLLEGLVAELPYLRAPAHADSPDPAGPVARRMLAAVRPHAAGFITPMAAVAGAVADHIRDAVLAAAPLGRVLVNNGGDIALHLAPGTQVRIAVGLMTGARPATITLAAADGIGGVATSGWRGRSHSLGIADAVTVLARDAASADAAATMIANAVDLPGSSAVTRRPAAASRIAALSPPMPAPTMMTCSLSRPMNHASFPEHAAVVHAPPHRPRGDEGEDQHRDGQQQRIGHTLAGDAGCQSAHRHAGGHQQQRPARPAWQRPRPS
jgi:ApbE superfamily uncharacterized protein (UPF0280 family)